MPTEIERCANCDSTIGRLETPFIWNNFVVCRACYERLQSAAAPSSPIEESAEELTDQDVVLEESELVANALQEAAQEALGARVPARPTEAVLYRAAGITVTTSHIIDAQWGRLPLEHVLSVKPGAGFLPGAIVVDVFDLVRHARRYRFRGSDNAKRFVAALQRAKGSINVEQDQSGWFIIWG